MRAEVTRARLLDAAQTVFAERGYHAAVMDDIVEAAGRSKGAAYFHFPSKHDIFEAVLRRMVDRLERKVEESISTESEALSRLDAALATVLDSFTRHRRMARLALIDLPAVGAPFQEALVGIRRRLAGLIETQLDAAIAEGAIEPVNSRLVSQAWFGAINEVVTEWVHCGDTDMLRTELPELRTTLLRSVGIDPRDTRPGAMPLSANAVLE